MRWFCQRTKIFDKQSMFCAKARLFAFVICLVLVHGISGGRISCLSWTPGNLEQLIRFFCFSLSFCFVFFDLIDSAARLVRPTVIGGMPSLFAALRTYRIDQTNLLGNRLRMVIIGGARSTPELKKWIFSALSAVCLDGYGTHTRKKEAKRKLQTLIFFCVRFD